MKEEVRRSLLPVRMIFFLDNFGSAIIYPILAPLLANPHWHLSPSTPRGLLLGLIVALFPLCQLLGAPGIGALSDRLGRRRVFLITLSGSCLGYMLIAVGILTYTLPLLFLGRACSGLFAGNLVLCLATVADVCHDPATRTQNFSILGALGGLCFALATLTGGFFSIAATEGRLNPSWPFWCTAGLALLNLVIVALYFREPASVERAALQGTPSSPPRSWLVRFREVAASKPLRHSYLIYFLFILCWSTSSQFLGENLLVSLGGTAALIMWVYLGIGILWCSTNLFMSRLWHQAHSRPSLRAILVTALTCAGTLLLTISFSDHLSLVIPCILMAALCSSLSWTHALALVSLSATAQTQGTALGMNQSVAALATVLGPSVGGLLSTLGVHWVYTFTGALALLGAFTASRYRY